MLWEEEEQEGVCDKTSSRASAISLGSRTPSEPGPPWTPVKGTPLVLWEVLFAEMLCLLCCGPQMGSSSPLVRERVRNAYSQACPHTTKSEGLVAAAGPVHRLYSALPEVLVLTCAPERRL